MWLTPEELLATLVQPMRRLAEVPRDEIEVWPYVEALTDLHHADITGNDVAHVFRSADDRYDHVLIPAARAGLYLVVVVELAANRILGHHVLYRQELYGLVSVR
jgi:hypothetical protein